MKSASIGCIAEYKFAVKAMEYGLFVSFPLLHTSPYDCIVESPKGLFKIQIKSVQNNRVVQRVYLKDCNNKRYTKNDVDFFAIYSQEKNGFFIFKNDGEIKSITLTSEKYSIFFNNFAAL